ncbi:MAG: carbamoyltransferase HypF [Propionibacteriaceae bacterium]|jgi:hydrogenase maturation protein HypF|nr:carbamoyltransferase HypF [Propionibacteriaceae bacterium]
MIRRQLTLTGVVQGVGFRPNVARIAALHPVTGLCGNDDNAVFIEAQGEPSAVSDFFELVRMDLPPLATIIAWRESELVVIPGEAGFRIVPSRRGVGAITLLPADAAICGDCLADIAEPTNRRFGYPFTTCTSCGPRLSIIRDVPYDRPLTTMAEFPMCSSCRQEYEDPSDRRFHAQPISCFDCGPDLWLEVSQGLTTEVPTDPQDRRARFAAVIAEASRRLRQGEILAVKGIGGFTLFCDARNPRAVATLRARKGRPSKPLAVMAGSVAAAQTIANLGQDHLRALTSREAPIVLAPMAETYDLADQVAPGLDDVGVMLAYAPLHRLLLGATDIMVATSANSSSKPLIYDNETARIDLGAVVDAFLMHDRGIHLPVEDSVVITDGPIIRPIRRSRGFAPLPVFLGLDHGVCRCVLAVGGELKNSFGLVRDGMVFLSAHVGDMGTLETQRAFELSVDQMVTAHRRTPELIVTDKHPGYATRSWGVRQAARLGVPHLDVQHHHAHALSLLAEYQRLGQPFTCIVLDGTGYGDDGTIWGGEILRLDSNPLEFERVWHLPGFWLPGGDSAVRHPWKSAAGLAWEYDIDLAALPGFAEIVSAEEWDLVQSQLVNQVGVIRTTSTGRLFDAIASLLGLRHSVTHEAQAAMELETLARRCPHDHQPSSPKHHPTAEAGVPYLVGEIIAGLAEGRALACLARLTHSRLARLLAEACPDSEAIGLTGGVFANRLLLSYLTDDLEALGHQVLHHQIVPPNDGGLALGQALAGVLSAQP